MFVYLSKKIAIPHNTRLYCVSWNSEQGWIACSGANGLLKVLKLDGKPTEKRGETNALLSAPTPTAESASAAAQGNLTMNQSLEGHTDNVMCAVWNENYRKLTTSDENGLIIVWMLHKGMWFEEMINNRNRSIVKAMRWTPDGQKICIVYADGAVIVGSVDGNRVWGKELETPLELVEWSPDGQNILFGTSDGEVLCYDNLGNFINRLSIYAVNTQSEANAQLVGIHWYVPFAVFPSSAIPCLAVVFRNGKLQIMRDDFDTNPVLIDTGMTITASTWNHDGTIFAIAGMIPSKDSPPTTMVQFYSPFGTHMRTLKVPQSSQTTTGITSISFEGGNLRLALSIDSFLYFANIRINYFHGYLKENSTVIYAFEKNERSEHCVGFWNINTDERIYKYVKNLLSVTSSTSQCLFTTRNEENPSQYILILCNAIGTPLESQFIDIEPVYVALTSHYVIISDGNLVYIWQFQSLMKKGDKQNFVNGKLAQQMNSKSPKTRERVLHIDDLQNVITVPNSSSQSLAASEISESTLPLNRSVSNDPICAITAKNNTLMVARSSGTLLEFSLPHGLMENVYNIQCRPQIMKLNCDLTRIAIIDINGVFTLFDFTEPNPDPKGTKGKLLDIERKDCWDLCWSEDNSELFAIMEKTRMYIFRNLSPEEPVLSHSYLCHFEDLCILAVNLDEIMNIHMTTMEQPTKDCLHHFETKSLRDSRELLASSPMEEAVRFIEDYSHPRLWMLVAESALENLNIPMAELAFVRCADYKGIQFVKRLKLCRNPTQQRAEIRAYFQKFDEAESLYLSMDAKESAIELRTMLGDHFRVVQLINSNGSGDDATLTKAYQAIGDYYYERQKWLKAYKFYSKSQFFEGMINSAYFLDDFATLQTLTDSIQSNSPLLLQLAEKFSSVGLCSDAVNCFIKCEAYQKAIDCCVNLNQWDLAINLAETYKITNIETILMQYASYLCDHKKFLAAIELYRKAGKHFDAANVLFDWANKEKSLPVLTAKPLKAKKLYVIAALEAEKSRDKLWKEKGANAKNQTDILNKLLSEDTMTQTSKELSKTITSPDTMWHASEAFHFYLLAHRQINSQKLDKARKTALLLREYDDILPTADVERLIAWICYIQRDRRECSAALIALESDPNLSYEEQQEFRQLSTKIFTRWPTDNRQFFTLHSSTNNEEKTRTEDEFACPQCGTETSEFSRSCSDCGCMWSHCVASGQALALVKANEIRTCTACKRKALESELQSYNNCPLCHNPYERSRLAL